MIARLAKGVLPANTQIQKDALLAMHKSATVFVSYIASKYAQSYSVLLLAPPCSHEYLTANNNNFFNVHPNTICFSSNDLARMSNKKTISPQDVMSALKDAELEGFLPRLEAELKSMFHSSDPPA
jgi:DNA polymerase epsilon subunit 3